MVVVGVFNDQQYFFLTAHFFVCNVIIFKPYYCSPLNFLYLPVFFSLSISFPRFPINFYKSGSSGLSSPSHYYWCLFPLHFSFVDIKIIFRVKLKQHNTARMNRFLLFALPFPCPLLYGTCVLCHYYYICI